MANEKISQYVVTVVTLQDTDLMDVSVDQGGGSFESQKMPFSVLKTNIPTLYSADSTLLGAREVDQNGNTLGFTNGLFGIGVAIPTLGKLQIDADGDSQATRTIFARDSSNANTHIWFDDGSVFHSSGISVGISTPGTNIGYNADGANFQFGFRAETIHTTGDAYGFFSTIVAVNANDNIGGFFNTLNGANNYAILVDQGDVGIGVLAPTEKFHLVGNFRYVDGSQAAGKVLTSDLNGVASWAVGGGNTIYTADDSLTGDRTITQGTNLLTFDGTSAGKVIITNTTATALKVNSTSANSAMEFSVSGVTKFTWGFFTSSNGPELFGGSLLASFNTSTGNIAFGAVATTANTPFRVKKNSATQQVSLFDNATGDNSIMIRSGVAKISKLDFDNGSFGDNGSVWSDNTDGLRLRTSSTDRLNIGRASGIIGIGKTGVDGVMDFNLTTEDFAIVDAGSVAATQQDWVEVKVGGNTGFIRIFATK